jgi:hypothetical protein
MPKFGLQITVQKRSQFHNDLSARISTNSLFGTFNWTHRWCKIDGKHTAREIAGMFNKIFTGNTARNGIAAKSTPEKMTPSQPGPAS